MPMVHRGIETHVTYPDGDSKVITLYVEPAEGQIIAHGWEIVSVVAGSAAGSGPDVAFRITVARPDEGDASA